MIFSFSLDILSVFIIDYVISYNYEILTLQFQKTPQLLDPHLINQDVFYFSHLFPYSCFCIGYNLLQTDLTKLCFHSLLNLLQFLIQNLMNVFTNRTI